MLLYRRLLRRTRILALTLRMRQYRSVIANPVQLDSGGIDITGFCQFHGFVTFP